METCSLSVQQVLLKEDAESLGVFFILLYALPGLPLTTYGSGFPQQDSREAGLTASGPPDYI